MLLTVCHLGTALARGSNFLYLITCDGSFLQDCFLLLFEPGSGSVSSQYFDIKWVHWSSKYSLLQVLFHSCPRCHFPQHDLLRIPLPVLHVQNLLSHIPSPWKQVLVLGHCEGCSRRLASAKDSQSVGSLQNQRWEMIPVIHPPEECLFSPTDYSLCQLKPAFVNHIILRIRKHCITLKQHLVEPMLFLIF